MARDFADQFSIPYPIYCDPQKQTYALMGWKRTLGIGFHSIRKGWKEFTQGHRQGNLPPVFVSNARHDAKLWPKSLSKE